jgi:hypothetical protein
MPLQAINTAKGRILEALFSHALRACRASDKQVGSHEAAWNELQPLFARELTKTETGNCEFSTLLEAYFANAHEVRSSSPLAPTTQKQGSRGSLGSRGS